ncbi:MAG: acyl-[acyl-carrier-protein]--UDP-N-acetylglucosamine O-acyltransferase, partial [Comamonadaceae bacterium]
YRDGATLEQAVQRIASLAQATPEAAADVQLMTDFLARATPQRGIVR